DRSLAAAVTQREIIGVLVLGILAPPGVVVVADLGSEPDAALGIDHGVVRIGGIVGRIGPEMLHAPEHGRTIRRGEARGNLRAILASGNIDSLGQVFGLIHDHKLAVAGVDSVVGSAAVDVGVVFVGRNLVVHEGVVVADVPEGGDHV